MTETASQDGNSAAEDSVMNNDPESASVNNIAAGFDHVAESMPENVALRFSGTDVSYEALRTTAWEIAAQLGDRVPARGRIGILGNHTVGSYAAVLAALYLGCSYVPLNPDHPVDRLHSILDMAGLDAIVVDHDQQGLLQEFRTRTGIPILQVQLDPDGRPRGHESSSAVAPRTLPARKINDEAYLLFTSGTTGRPKGVPVTHGSVSHFMRVNSSRYKPTSRDRFSQTFDLTFDLSVFDMFMCWNAGATLCIPQPLDLVNPHDYINRNQITIWFSVPSVISILRRHDGLRPGAFPTLRWSLFCGEALPASGAGAWQDAAPYSVLENLYGPTELTIACSVYRWEPGKSERFSTNGIVPIGEVYDGLEARILDMDETGAGELAVAGPQTFRGYVGDLNRDRLLSLVSASGMPATFYRTGDRVRKRETCGYEYIGRLDDQVKLGGYRIELREIEGVAEQVLSIVKAVVVKAGEGADARLALFYLGDPAASDLVRGCLERALPRYMIPKLIFNLTEFPLNANGKIDRNALEQRVING